MSVARSQAQTFLRLAKELRPYWRRDHALPARIQAMLSRDHSFGSRDRRLYRELLYTTIRFLPWVEPYLERQPDEALRRLALLAAAGPATQNFRAEFASGTAPEGDRAELFPHWFTTHCPELFRPAELDVQLRRAPLWLRVQTDRTEAIAHEFADRGWRWRHSTVLASALEVLDEADVTKSEAWQNGAIEVQDLGSQLLLETIGVEAGGHWLDACAGAGGKSLQLSRMLGRQGSVDAHDVRLSALEELTRRAQRARIKNIRTTQRPVPAYDGVLVDAPCSGSGTWRRAPHLKWTTTPELVTERATLQQQLLARFATHVRPGGRLVYATCSLSSVENEKVVTKFLETHRHFQPEAFAQSFGANVRDNGGLLILPSLHDTDGFFVASLRRAN